MRWFAVVPVVLALACGDDPKLLNTTNNVANNTNNANNTTTNNGTNDEFNNFPDVNNEFDDEDSIALNNDVPGSDSRDYVGTLPTRPTAEVEAFVYDMGKAYCERLVECRTDSRVVRFASGRQIGDVGACLDDFLARLSPASFQGSVTAGDRTFNSGTAAQCLTALGSLACGDVLPAFEGPGVMVPECREAFDGDGRELADCVSNADCLTGLFCDRSFDANCAGACVAGYIESVSCGEASTACTIDEFCDPEDSMCKPLPNTGEACGPEGICAANNFCFMDVCTSTLTGFQAGQSCDRISALCALGLFCDLGTGDIGTCKELVGPGGSCNAAVWPGGCDETSFCDAGTCRAKTATGECTNADACLGGWCAVDACVDTSTVCAL